MLGCENDRPKGTIGTSCFCQTSNCSVVQEMFSDLGDLLCSITGFDSFSLQPNAGAAGEYAGLMVIRAYHMVRSLLPIFGYKGNASFQKLFYFL